MNIRVTQKKGISWTAKELPAFQGGLLQVIDISDRGRWQPLVTELGHLDQHVCVCVCVCVRGLPWRGTVVQLGRRGWPQTERQMSHTAAICSPWTTAITATLSVSTVGRQAARCVKQHCTRCTVTKHTGCSKAFLTFPMSHGFTELEEM